MRVDILVTNTRCKIEAGTELLNEIHEDFKIKVKGAFFSPAWRNRTWDGKKVWVDKYGGFEAGLLPKVIDYFKKEKIKVRLHDNRDLIEPDNHVEQIEHMVLRPPQLAAVSAVINAKVKGIPFPRVILEEATNFGKSLVAAAIFLSYPEDTVWFLLIHRQFIHKQLVKELKELLHDEVGVIDSDTCYIKRFNICMVQSLANKLTDPKVKKALANADGVIGDECHRSATGQYKKVLAAMYNCPHRIGMSGTPFDMKDLNVKEEILANWGPVIHKYTNEEMVAAGYSTKPIITMILGETRYRMPGDYKGEYDKVITNNAWRRRFVWRRVTKRAIDKDRLPALIFCKYIDHAEKLLLYCPQEILDKYRVGILHVKVPKRKRMQVLEDFTNGKIDILIATHILQEGQNMPLTQYMLNAGGSDSHITIKQILGRMLRTHETKKRVYVDDIYDRGVYMRRHSQHRLIYYRQQNLGVKELHKVTAKKKGIRL